MDVQFAGKLQESTRALLIQGENNLTTINFYLPAIYSGVDLSSLTWALRSVNQCTGSFFSIDIAGEVKSDSFVLSWLVGDDFTGEPGKLEITLVGSLGVGDTDVVLAKFVYTGAEVRQNTGGSFPPQKSYLDVVLAEIDDAANRAETAADKAESYSANTPKPMDDTWWVWDGAEYIDTGESSRGQDGRVYEVHAGAGVEVDNTDPANPIINATGTGAGDMLKSVYDPDSSVEAAGGIPAYVDGHSGTGDMRKEDYDADGAVEAAGGIAQYVEEHAGGEGFTVYVHSKNGTVHSLVNPDGNENIKFTATADYAAGDTFEVNGAAYDAKLVNGAPLSSRSFISGASVSCVVGASALFFSTPQTMIISATPRAVPGKYRYGKQVYCMEVSADLPNARTDLPLPSLSISDHAWISDALISFISSGVEYTYQLSTNAAPVNATAWAFGELRREISTNTCSIVIQHGIGFSSPTMRAVIEFTRSSDPVLN